MNCLRLGALTMGVSLLASAPAMAQQTTPAHATIAAAETNINVSLGFMHTDYSEGSLDSEKGFTPGFGVGASALLPSAFPNIDLYTAFTYKFSAGNLNYSGHYLYSGLPATATDRAVFNNIDARLGLGFPLANSAVEIIPYLTAGYQSWNRNDDIKGATGTDEFYSSAVLGGGMKVDVPVTPTLVFSGSAEFLGMVGAHVTSDTLGNGFDMGDSAQERVSLGVDQALSGQIHFFAGANLTHFNYAGSKPTAESGYYYEPLSNTTQVGMNLGISYSF